MAGLAARAIHLLAVLLAVSFVNFLLVDTLPGDAAAAALGEWATSEDLAQYRRSHGLDGSFVERYLTWLRAAAGGDLGDSLHTGEPVSDLVGERLGISLALLALSLLMAVPTAVLLAVASATAPGSVRDKVLGSITFAIVSTPTFVIGLLLTLVFAVQLRWLPAAGYAPLSSGLWAHLHSLLLPAVSLALAEIPVMVRVLRNDLIDVLGSGYIRAATARGLPFTRLLLVHALRPSSQTLVTIIALNAGNLIGGAVIIETLFAVPGLGRLLVTAVDTRDLALIQGIVLVMALAYVLFNTLADVVTARIDPRSGNR
ncbi:MAG: ABC transporter permease [Gammaproteobacteria bacterium]|nr:ABC transporter permease [Gammaproteobacteria bacterium]